MQPNIFWEKHLFPWILLGWVDDTEPHTIQWNVLTQNWLWLYRKCLYLFLCRFWVGKIPAAAAAEWHSNTHSHTHDMRGTETRHSTKLMHKWRLFRGFLMTSEWFLVVRITVVFGRCPLLISNWIMDILALFERDTTKHSRSFGRPNKHLTNVDFIWLCFVEKVHYHQARVNWTHIQMTKCGLTCPFSCPFDNVKNVFSLRILGVFTVAAAVLL